MLQEIYIGSVPLNEDIPQEPLRLHKQCLLLAAQLKRMFGPEPIGAIIKVKRRLHDLGMYSAVYVEYDESFVDAIRYAFKVEQFCPEYWDREAQKAIREAW